ncbi:S-layer homology domain-containing protein [Dethiosulfatibacter aminovorans DSM 17477]|uniref:S-layer homology domain-containing protein n=1 Tax=Dethiosulfatibacter aminovorans DSM 17477 TaxID=1121476 RepID=A0A1M6D1F4_9FIRM|nr:S-layer homology domain-containing protein [Dethiosulfatibacter aminovorans]SHI66808.1 S-layer homology domain-containing protein [Dethiosulfatibacter aminovorans DSM 17477]
MKKIKVLIIALVITVLMTVSAGADVYYFDIYDHWAEDDIYYATNSLNIFNGYGDWTFRPDNNVTVSEFIKIIYKIGNENGILGIDMTGDAEYADIDLNHWAYTYIMSIDNYMKRTHRINITLKDIFPEESLEPDRFITRYEAALLTSVLSLPSVDNEDLPFYDIDADDKFADIFKELFNNEIYLGFSDNMFRPDTNLTRAEAAVVSKRIFKEAVYSKNGYLDGVTYFNNDYLGEFPLFFNYENNNLTEDDFRYIKAVTTIEYLEFGGYIFPEDEPLYDLNPVRTLRELDENDYFNKIGVHYYLLLNDDITDEVKLLHSNAILDSMLFNTSIGIEEKLILLHELVNYDLDKKMAIYLEKTRKRIEDDTLKADIDFLLMDYYNKNEKFAELYEMILGYEDLDLISGDFIDLNIEENEQLEIQEEETIDYDVEFDIIEKYITNIAYSLYNIGFYDEAENFVYNYIDKFNDDENYSGISDSRFENFTGIIKKLKIK